MTSKHDSESGKRSVDTTDEIESLPVPVQKTQEQIHIEELEECLRNSRANNTALQAQLAESRAVIGHQALQILGYIEQDVVAGKKWRDKFEATAVELRLLQKTGLSSGCGCPIGVCLGANKSTALGGACWVLWAEAFVLKRQAEIVIDEIRTQACHPARVAAAQRQRALAGTPDAKP